MSRSLATRTKVAGGCDKPLAKMPLPNPVHKDASRQRVRGPRDPIRQLKSTTARFSRNNFATEHFKISARNFVAEPMWLAAQLQTAIAALTALGLHPITEESDPTGEAGAPLDAGIIGAILRGPRS